MFRKAIGMVLGYTFLLTRCENVVVLWPSVFLLAMAIKILQDLVYHI